MGAGVGVERGCTELVIYLFIIIFYDPWSCFLQVVVARLTSVQSKMTTLLGLWWQEVAEDAGALMEVQQTMIHDLMTPKFIVTSHRNLRLDSRKWRIEL